MERRIQSDFAPLSQDKARLPILCIDDDPTVLRLREKILLRAGYAVVTRTEPKGVLSENLGRFLLAIVDLDMPECNGVELARHFRAKCCELPILLVSGSVDKLTPDEQQLFTACLPKGQSMELLLRAIGEATKRTAPMII